MTMMPWPGVVAGGASAPVITVPAAPTLTLTGGAGSLTVGIVDGSDGGSPITGHTLWLSTTNGFTPGAGNLFGPVTNGQVITSGIVSNGTVYYGILIATNAIGNSANSAQASGTPTAVAFPQLAAIVGRWRTADLPVVADGTAVSSWTDSTTNAQVLATGLGNPTYKVNRYGGYPTLLFNGSQSLIGAATQCIAAVTAGNFTMMVIYAAVQSTQFGFLASVTDSTGINLQSNGTLAGAFAGGENIPYSGSGFSTGAQSSTTTYAVGTNQRQVFVNGGLIAQASQASGGTFTQLGVGASRTGIGGAKAEILEVIFWNRKLTVYEAVQAERAARDFYGQTYPWSAQGYYYMATGDSITYGLYVNLRAKSWPYLLSTALSMPMGSWGNIGYIGANATNIQSIVVAEGLNNLQALTGVRTKFTYAEFYNQRGAATAPIASSVAVSTTQSVLTQLKTTAGDKVFFMDTWDYASRGAEKGRWTGYWVTPANQTGYMDGYYQLSADANLGVDGACGNSAPYGPYFANANGGAIVTANALSGSPILNITGITGGTPAVGMYVSVPNVPVGTTITIAPGGTGAYTMSNPTTGAVTGNLYTSPANQTFLLVGDGVHIGNEGAALMPGLISSGFAAM